MQGTEQLSDNAQRSLDLPPMAVKKATVWQRWSAYLMDGIILAIVGALMDALITETTPSWWDAVVNIVGFIFFALYWVWPYSTNGQTVGKRLCGIRVVSTDGSPLNWRKGVLRTVGYIVSSIPLDLGFLWAIWDRDKQAWHDKIAGTYVVPISVTHAQPQGTIDPAKARRREWAWLLALGLFFAIPCALLGFVFVRLYQSGTAEMNAMGTWPGPEASPEELISVDLSHLGLTMGEIRDARDDPQWGSPYLEYEEGRAIDYRTGETVVVSIWALKHNDAETAVNDFGAIADWAYEACSPYTAGGGVIHCRWSNASDKIFGNDRWIVGITAMEGTEFTPEILVDKVRDALAVHWKVCCTP